MTVSTAVLLNPDDPTFDFHHAMSHRAYMAIMAPLTRFSVMPYFIEPAPHPPPRPATMWPLKHQRAHDDFTNAVPSTYNGARFGILTNQILVDNDLRTPEGRSWNTFVNFQEHYIADQTMQPLPTPTAVTLPPPWFVRTGMTYPFW